jgi:hypothetical protein
MLLEIIAFARQQLFDHVTVELRALHHRSAHIFIGESVRWSVKTIVIAAVASCMPFL